MAFDDNEDDILNTDIPPSYKDPEEMEPNDLGQLPPKSEDDVTSGEYDASEEIGQEAAGPQFEEEQTPEGNVFSLPNAPMSKGPANSLDRYKQFMEQYKALQDKRQSDQNRGGIVAGLAGIAQSIAARHTPGFKQQSDDIYNFYKEKSNRPVTDFEEAQKVQKAGIGLEDEKSARDPKSKISEAYRQYATKRLGLQLTDDVSAFDVQNLLKSAGKPQASKFATHPMINKQTGEAIEAKIDMTTGKAYDLNDQPLDANWTRNYANRVVKDPNSKEQRNYNPALGKIGATLTGPSTVAQPKASEIKDSAEAWNSLDARTKDSVDKEYRPTFNKLVEKPLQRIGHVPAILERLEEAQHNPAALGQLKAELTRFDVGDNRLAVQEFEMFAKRHGYKGWGDLLADKTTGTITADFADDFRRTITSTAKALKSDIDKKAEDQAKMINSRLPKDKKIDPKILAPLLYGDYDPNHDAPKNKAPEGKVRVKNTKTGQEGFIPKENLKKAVDSGQYQEVK